MTNGRKDCSVACDPVPKHELGKPGLGSEPGVEALDHLGFAQFLSESDQVLPFCLLVFDDGIGTSALPSGAEQTQIARGSAQDVAARRIIGRRQGKEIAPGARAGAALGRLAGASSRRRSRRKVAALRAAIQAITASRIRLVAIQIGRRIWVVTLCRDLCHPRHARKQSAAAR